jgi:hypothetical protein
MKVVTKNVHVAVNYILYQRGPYAIAGNAQTVESGSQILICLPIEMSGYVCIAKMRDIRKK